MQKGGTTAGAARRANGSAARLAHAHQASVASPRDASSSGGAAAAAALRSVLRRAYSDGTRLSICLKATLTPVGHLLWLLAPHRPPFAACPPCPALPRLLAIASCAFSMLAAR